MEPLRIAHVDDEPAIEPVCCLECSRTYAKPSGGGTISTNPGCPYCGYVGWAPISAAPPRVRSGVDRRPRHAGRWR